MIVRVRRVAPSNIATGKVRVRKVAPVQEDGYDYGYEDAPEPMLPSEATPTKFQPAMQMQDRTDFGEPYRQSAGEFNVTTPFTRGSLQADQSNALLDAMGGDQSAIQRLVESNRKLEQLPQSSGGEALSEAKTFGQAAGAFIRNPMLAPEVAAESFTAQMKTGAPIIGAGGAIAANLARVPLVGQVANAVGAGLGSYKLSKTEAMLNALQESGVNIQDSTQVATALSNPVIRDKIKTAGVKYGLPVAIMDALSAGIAGRLFRAVGSKTIGRKAVEGGVELATQMGFGAGGEVAGELASGQAINPASVIAEMFGELGTAPIEIAGGLASRDGKTSQTPPVTSAPSQPIPSPVSAEVPPKGATWGSGYTEEELLQQQGELIDRRMKEKWWETAMQKKENVDSRMTDDEIAKWRADQWGKEVWANATPEQKREWWDANLPEIERRFGEKYVEDFERELEARDYRLQNHIDDPKERKAYEAWWKKAIPEAVEDIQPKPVETPVAVPEVVPELPYNPEMATAGDDIASDVAALNALRGEVSPPRKVRVKPVTDPATLEQLGKTETPVVKENLTTETPVAPKPTGKPSTLKVGDEIVLKKDLVDKFYGVGKAGQRAKVSQVLKGSISVNLPDGSLLSINNDSAGEGYAWDRSTTPVKEPSPVEGKAETPKQYVSGRSQSRRVFEPIDDSIWEDREMTAVESRDETADIRKGVRNSPFGFSIPKRKGLIAKAESLGAEVVGQEKYTAQLIRKREQPKQAEDKVTPVQTPDYRRTMNIDGDDITIELTPEKAAEFDRLNTRTKERGKTLASRRDMQAGWKAPSDPDQGLRSPETQFGIDSKSDAMRTAAEKRALDPRWATMVEKANAAKKEKTNYVGKRVSVDGKLGKVTGMSFGKPVVQFDDGTKRSVATDDVTPVQTPAVAVQKPADKATPTKPVVKESLTTETKPVKTETRRQKTEREDSEDTAFIKQMLDEKPDGFYLAPSIGISLKVKALGGESLGGNRYRKTPAKPVKDAKPSRKTPVIEKVSDEDAVLSAITKDGVEERILPVITGENKVTLNRILTSLQLKGKIHRGLGDKWVLGSYEPAGDISPTSDVAELKSLMGKKGETQSLGAGIDPRRAITKALGVADENHDEAWRLVKKIATDKLKTTGNDFAEWSKAVMKDIQGLTDKHLKTIWNEVAPKANPPEVAPKEEKAVGLSKAAVAEERIARGLDELPKATTRTWKEARDTAIKDKLDENALSMATALIVEPREISDVESFALLIHKAKLEDQYAAKLDEAEKTANNQVLLEEADLILNEIDTIDRASRASKSEVARSLASTRAMMSRGSYELAAVMQRARISKGTALSAEERAKVKKLVDDLKVSDDRVKELEAKLAEMEEAQEKQLAKSQITKERTIKVKREKIQATRDDIKARFRSMGYRVNDVTGVTSEGLYLLGKYAATYVQDGVVSIDELVTRIQRDMPDFTARDIYRALIARDPNSKTKVRKETSLILASLKRQASILLQIEKLSDKMDNVSTLKSRLSALMAEAYSANYNQKTLENIVKTISEIQDKLSIAPEGKKAGTDPQALRDAKEKLDTLRKLMKIEAETADYEQQLASGDFKIKPPKVIKPVPPQLANARLARERAKREVAAAIERFRTKRLSEKLLDIATAPRALKATADMSYALRQGLILSVTRPVVASRIAVKAAKAFWSKNTAELIDFNMRQSPMQPKREQAKLYLSPIAEGSLRNSEEAFVSGFLSKIPGLRSVIGASERNMITGLNLLRTSVFDEFVRTNPNATTEELQAWADFVNKASGRGTLDAGKLKTALDIAFFSPRFAVSRIQTPLTITKYWKLPRVRKQIAKELSAFIALGLSAISMAVLSGAVSSLDPRDPNFGKIRIGNTVIDVWAGVLQPVRALARLVIIPFERAGVVGKYKRLDDPLSVIGRFAAYKMSPAITLPYELIYGRNIIGQPRTPLQTLAMAPLPIIAESVWDAYMIDGIGSATGVGTGSFVGLGIDTYAEKMASNKKAAQYKAKTFETETYNPKLFQPIKYGN